MSFRLYLEPNTDGGADYEVGPYFLGGVVSVKRIGNYCQIEIGDKRTFPISHFDLIKNDDTGEIFVENGQWFNEKEVVKLDQGKVDLTLCPPQIILDIAEVREYGVKKYKNPDNWKKVEMGRYVKALLRHTLEFWKNQDSVDEESGIKNYKMIACNLAFICEMMANKEAYTNTEEETK